MMKKIRICVRNLPGLILHLLSDVDLTPTKKKRGRPAKRNETEQTADERQRAEVEASKKAKRVLNRFDGLSVEEVMARTLPDVIAPNLDILIVWHFFQTFSIIFFQR